MPDEKDRLWQMEIPELELRVAMCNTVIKWLRSGDPMLSDPKFSQLVPKRIADYEAQRAALVEVCRAKKIARDGDGKAPVAVEVQSANMTARRL